MPIKLFVRFARVLFLVLATASTALAADFGAKVPFKQGAEIQFPGFTIAYVGQRRVASDKYPRGFLYRDFRVTSASGTQTVSWTAGTGEIGPLLFHVGKEGFFLELAHSDKLGWLKENELVLSRAP